MRARLVDQDARDRIAQDLGTTLVVEAAAGTGKTSALVARMVAALQTGRAELAKMVALTFTDMAAGELKLRLRGKIEEARSAPGTAPEARENLTRALAQLEEARIGTIHAFCAELLRERPVQAKVDPLFEVAPDDVARGLFDRAFDRWMEAELKAPDPSVRRILRRAKRNDEGPRSLLRHAAWELALRRDFPTPWRREPFAREEAMDALLAKMADVGALAEHLPADDYLVRSLEEVRRFVADVQARERVHGRDYDGLEARLVDFEKRWHSKWVGSRGGFDKTVLLVRRDTLRAEIQELVRRAGADLAPALRDALWPVVESYESLKKRAGCLDFLDLLLCARDLVRDDADVRHELQKRFQAIFVDEFQDTDPLQAEILFLLAADDPAETAWERARPVPGKLFLVGDPKQSIYRFRRADVALYEAAKRRLAAAGAAVLHLTVSFRAVPEIQRAVNAAFASRMDGVSPSQASYVPLSPFREDVLTQPAVVALPVPAPYGDFRTIVNWRIDESLPQAVAAFVFWLVKQSGWTVTETARPEERVPALPHHVCLLFRRFRSGGTDITRPYVRALEARRLPHVLVGGSSFHEREEIEALRNALCAIERPEDELSVFATLRGPFFALSDAALLAWRHQLRTLHPFRQLPEPLPPGLGEVAEALGVLRELHRQRNRRPFADTVGQLLSRTRAHAGLAIWPTGEQALANVARLLDLARRAERRGLTSFRAFVQRLCDDAGRGEAGDAPIVEAGTEGVRLMTVHRAKGLELPVVILADLTAREAPLEAGRVVDGERRLCAMRLAGCSPPELALRAEEELAREREEATRLLYVAATRARDLLVVSALSDERREDGWLAALDPAIHPVERAPPETRAPAGCPTFGDDAVVSRPTPAPARAVSPGQHRPQAGEHRVVWWDPHLLELDAEEGVGLRQQELLKADEGGLRSQEGIRAHAAWQAERLRVRSDGSRPALRVVTATEAAKEGTAAVEVALDEVEPAGARPHGKRFGTLVHAVLAAVGLDAAEPEVREGAQAQARLLGATEEEGAAAAVAVTRALAHPLLRRAARAAECRRETPICARADDGTIVEGVVDAAFRDGEPPLWTVIDFKTDAEIAGRLEEYRRQVGIYAAAIARATGEPVRAVLLRV